MTRFTKIFAASVIAAAAFAAIAPPAARACGSYAMSAEEMERQHVQWLVTQHLQQQLDRQVTRFERVDIRSDRAAVRVRDRASEGAPERLHIVWLRRDEADGWRVAGVSRSFTPRTNRAS